MLFEATKVVVILWQSWETNTLTDHCLHTNQCQRDGLGGLRCSTNSDATEMPFPEIRGTSEEPQQGSFVTQPNSSQNVSRCPFIHALFYHILIDELV